MKTLATTLHLSENTPLKTLTLAFAGSLLIAASAQVTIPFLAVPFTLHTAAVMWLSLKLGQKNAVLAVLLYLAEVTLGLPFLNMGQSNPFALIGPTGGYLFGLIPLAALFSTSLKSSFAFLLQLGLGALILSFYVGAESALMMGFLPFIPVEAFKMLTIHKLCQSAKNNQV